MKITDTWMPLYIGDYLRDTSHLSTCEHGAYLLLLMHAWTQHGKLPANSERLRRITKMGVREWRRSEATLMQFFRLDGEWLRHKRLDIELGKATSITEQRKMAGKASSDARKRQREGNGKATGGQQTSNEKPNEGQQNTDEKHDPVATAGQQSPRPSPSPSPSEEKKEGSLRSLARQKPNGSNEFDRFWAEYPRKVAKLAAQKAFLKALKIANIDTIMDGLERYEFADDHTKQPHPATWLNGGCWMVEANTPPPNVAKPKPQQSELAEFVSAMNLFGNNNEQPPVIDEHGRVVA